MIILPVYKVAVLPRAAAYIRADAFAENAGRPAQAGEKVILLPAKENTARGALTEESFQSLAVTGVVREGVVNVKIPGSITAPVQAEEIMILE